MAMRPSLAPNDAAPSPKLVTGGQTQAAMSEKEPPASVEGHLREKVLTAVIALFVAAGFMATSSVMVLFNKTLMRPQLFPFPAFLTSLHMLGSWVLAMCLRAVAPALFPSSEAIFSKPREDPELGMEAINARAAKFWEMFQRFVPIGICFAISLVSGNWAYQVAPVTFLQTIKEGQIGLVYMMAVVFGLERFSWRSVAILAFTAGSSTFAVYHQSEPSIAGLILQTVCGMAVSTQAALMSRLMGELGGIRLDPLTVVLCLAPVTFLALMPVNFIMWDARIPSHLIANWHLLASNVLLAFVLQVMQAVSLKVLSSVGQGLVSTMKDVLIMLAASQALHEEITCLQIFGFTGAVFGVGLYSATKLFPEVFDTKRDA